MRCNKFRASNSLSVAQLVEQRLGLLQVERIEALRESAVDRREKIVGFVPLVIVAERQKIAPPKL
ncbi:hypothetical protein [Bradyrhizobium sp. dw_411]|uniref:hypothetical protein n=1 Tax=Bradyrhizobium sp. dw_411 TaxID=2720082 RepID=UPI001BCEA1F0|nr:hypothetical protein [Bradyrhizobium sp. dw_411]